MSSERPSGIHPGSKVIYTRGSVLFDVRSVLVYAFSLVTALAINDMAQAVFRRLGKQSLWAKGAYALIIFGITMLIAIFVR